MNNQVSVSRSSASDMNRFVCNYAKPSYKSYVLLERMRFTLCMCPAHCL